MNSIIVGIAGGSGAGKSTVCYDLVDNYPDRFELINLDDYQKKKNEPNLPIVDGAINWDHPNIINWEKLIDDIRALRDGRQVVIEVWSHRSNPDYAKHGQMIPRTLYPRPVILLEGYLALYNEALNELFSRKFYLDLDDATRNLRRGKNDVIADSNYVQKVLIPMHKKYVEPTKNNADMVIDVSRMNTADVSRVLYAQLI